MTDFIAFSLVPIFAKAWLAAGALILALEILAYVRARGKVAGAEGLDEGCKSQWNANYPMISLAVCFLVAGVAFSELAKSRAQGPELIIVLFGSVNLLGTIVALVVLLRGARSGS
ncbi:MAG: hypothetical protein ACTHJK_06400 [Sphingomicrobium sp.]